MSRATLGLILSNLKFVHFAFTEPRDRHSFIVSVSFSSKGEDAEG
jgi:hypothetical protein